MAGSAAQILGEAGATLKPEVFGRALTVAVDKLRPNAWNPNFQDEATFRRELASIRRFGFVDPIVVRKDGAMYEIIDGEHRWKAAVELGFTEIPVYDISPISEHEAKQLTVVLNELRGKPQEKKLGELLRDLLSSSTLDELVEVMPYSKEEYGKIAQLPGYDWEAFKDKVRGQQSERWVERIFRLPAEAAAVLDEALTQAKAGQDTTDAEALRRIAAEYIT
jgi:ParB-like nuclease domain